MVSVEAGPPAVAIIGPVVTFDSTQQSRYAAQWDSLEREAEPLRDSIAVQDSVVRFAMGQGYQDAAKSHVELRNRLARTLHQRNELFVHQLRDYLTKDQIKRYEKYLDDHKAGPPLRELPSGRRTRR
jgi:hypothetical protein